MRHENYPGTAAMYGAEALPFIVELNEGESTKGTLYFGLNNDNGPYTLVYDYGTGRLTVPFP